MNVKDFFEDLFVYNYQVNQELIAHFEEYAKANMDKALQLFNHLLDAHQVWNSRILEETSYGVWEIHPFTCLTKINAFNYEQTKYILTNFTMESKIQYRNSQGHLFENSIYDILFQINNHSCYHRGQIAYEIRLNHHEPVPTDYILYKRKGFLS